MEVPTYPLLCMDCAQPSGERSSVEHSTGLCPSCYIIREVVAERRALRTTLIHRVLEEMDL